MAIQYYMRGYNTAAPGAVGYVEWVVNDTPDSTAAFVPSPYVSGNIANVTVNRIVQSKTENWLQPDQGYITDDGKFFHLNSFDQLHASVPAVTVIPVPTGLVGIAVTRGGTTNSSGLLLPGASTNFFSTLLWDEAAGRWKFIQNTNGDHTTQGAYQPVNMGDLIINGFINVDGYVAIGNNPALSGALRLTNGQWIESRRATAADGYVIRLDTTDRVQIGTATESPVVYIPGNLRVDGYVRDGGTFPATTGFIRNSNSTNIEVARDSTNANDHILTSTNNTATDTNTGSTLNNNLVVGNANSTFGNVVYNTSTSRAHQFQTNSTTLLEFGATGNTATNDANNFIRFSAATVLPTIYQFHATVGTGQRLNVQAQSTTAASQTGGIVSLTSGSAPATGFGGAIELYTGNGASFPVAATLKMRINPTTAPTAADNNSIQLFENLIRIDSAQTSPRYRQDDVNIVSTPGQTFTIQAQNALGATSAGGNLNLTSGTGTTVAGDVFIQTGGVNRVQVTPTQTAIFGNLLVGGTVTSIASTVVELADRVIHVNSSANTYPAASPIPTLITGFSVDRGTTGGSKRDYHGLFWHEVDGYWKFSVNTDGYSTENSLSTNLPVVAQYMHMQPSATITVNAVPTTGSYRALNNVVHSAARSQAGTQDLILVSTDATDHLIWGAATNNAGHIFRTTTGTIYDFRVADVSTYTLTPQSAGTTTLQATAGVTALVYSHQTTGAASGAPTSLQAQSAATNGGNLILSSGQGSVDANDGYVSIETGNLDRIIARPDRTEFWGPTVSPAEALRITPISSGTTQITYAATVTAAQFNQTTTGGATGAPMTFQAQNAATTGGAIFITSGTGATAGDVNIQTGAVSKIIVHPTFTEFRDTAEAYRITPISAGTTTLEAASTVTALTYRQADLTTNAATGATTTIQAQNETGTTSTGGALVLTTGTGTTTAGNLSLQTGAVDKIIIHPTFTEFRDTAEALRITPVSAGTTAITFASTVTAVSINQTSTASTPSANWTIQSQVTTAASGVGGNISVIAGNATGTTSTGGNAIVTSGTGTTVAGNTQLQTGGVDRVVVHPTFTEFRDTAEAYRITPVSAGATTLQAISTATSVTYNQGDLTTASGTGAATTIQAQNETGTTSTGGALNLTSGTGTTTDGYVNLQAGGSTVARVHTNKFIFSKGWRRNVALITGAITVPDGYDYLAVTSLTAAFTITLPASPVLGDTFEIKDTTGNAATFNVTISGNGNNIDGAGTFVLTQAYASVVVTYTGTQWSIT